MRSRISIGLSGSFLLLLVVILVLYAHSDIAWANWRVPTCYPACFCEAFHPGPVPQPQSSYSNLIFVILGLYLMNRVPRSSSEDGGVQNYWRRWPMYSWLYGLAVFVIGLTSLFYHISLTLVGQYLDYIGMYLFLSLIVLYQLLRWGCLAQKKFIGVYVTVNLLLISGLLAMPTLRRVFFTALLVLMLVLEALLYVRRPAPRIRVAYFGMALLCFCIALVTNLLDEQGVLCRPDSWWQWHTVWHVLLAVAMGLLYAYFLSEVLPASGQAA